MTAQASTITLKAKASEAAALKDLLDELVPNSRRETGCIAYDAFSIDEENWLILEIWRDADAFEQHLNEPYTQKALTAFASLLAAAPIVQPMQAYNVAGMA